MNNLKNIYFFRHGETNLNVCGVIMGQDNKIDTTITQNGYRQIDDIIFKCLDKNIDIIYSSDTGRTLTTARLVNENLKVPTIITKELRGLNMGIFQGLDMNELFTSSIAEECFKNHNIAFPGGESINDLNNRLFAFVCNICRTTNYSNIVCITHSAAMSNLKSFLCNEPYDAITECHLIWKDEKLSVADFSKCCVDKKEMGR